MDNIINETKSNVIEKIVPDTSIIIEGLLSDKISNNEIKAKEIIIHEAVIAELEHQANLGKSIGFVGLEEIKKLRDIAAKSEFELVFRGDRPRASEIRNASLGEIDSMIRQLAFDEDAILITSDKVQWEVALARGVKTLYFRGPERGLKKLKLERFFDETTMSVHLRENVMPYAKKGMPGSWDFIPLRKAVVKQEEIQEITAELIEEAKLRKDGFIEIERKGSTIIQLGKFRIVITKPPFSDGWEITAVRPVKRLNIDDYKLSDKLNRRISSQAEGVLVAGSPGMGKTTFSQALAEFYAKDKIVKTVEAPRDLILPDNITQYAISHGSSQEIHDILLLSRPDYTFFDEMRNTDDFKLFADLRLAGVGMVGVVHATNAIDAIQRFLGRVEMGVIPQIIDTVFFIKDGFINRVLSLKMTVKVPSGMTEADLARPIVVVTDFETGKEAYEIYSYGEQTVVVPVQETKKGDKKGIHKLAELAIEDEFSRYSSMAKVEVVSDNKCIVYVPERDIAKIIGKQGKNISMMEKSLGMSVEVRELGDRSSDRDRQDHPDQEPENPPEEKQEEIQFELLIDKKNIIFNLTSEMQNKDIDVYVNDELLMTAKAGKTGLIKVKKNNNVGKVILDAKNKGDKITLFV